MVRALHSVAVCNDEGLRGSGGASGTNASVGIFCVTGKAVTYKAREPAPRSPSGRGQRAGCWRYGEEVKVALFGAEFDCALATVANWGRGRNACATGSGNACRTYGACQSIDSVPSPSGLG